MRTPTQSSTLMQSLGALETGHALGPLNDSDVEAAAGMSLGPTQTTPDCIRLPATAICRHIDTAVDDGALEAAAPMWAGPTSVHGGCPLQPTILGPGCRFHIDTDADDRLEDRALEAAAEQWANPSGPPCFVPTLPPRCLPKHIDDDRPN
jgi:hypothetical protein